MVKQNRENWKVLAGRACLIALWNSTRCMHVMLLSTSPTISLFFFFEIITYDFASWLTLPAHPSAQTRQQSPAAQQRPNLLFLGGDSGPIFCECETSDKGTRRPAFLNIYGGVQITTARFTQKNDRNGAANIDASIFGSLAAAGAIEEAEENIDASILVVFL